MYCAKANKKDRNGSKHPTIKPISLMQWLCRMITPPGGCVLDPFAGSGTTGTAAVREGFQIILCENETEYQDDIRRRFIGPVDVGEVDEEGDQNGVQGVSGEGS
jgi:site-specific DNA-methyltransferase (adenine-specific)